MQLFSQPQHLLYFSQSPLVFHACPVPFFSTTSSHACVQLNSMQILLLINGAAESHRTKILNPLPHETPYHYYVSKGACIAFIFFFSLSTSKSHLP